MKFIRDMLDIFSVLFGVICVVLPITGNLDLNNIQSLLISSGILLLLQSFK